MNDKRIRFISNCITCKSVCLLHRHYSKTMLYLKARHMEPSRSLPMYIRVAKGTREAAFSSVCDFESGSRNVHDDDDGRFEEKRGGGGGKREASCSTSPIQCNRK